METKSCSKCKIVKPLSGFSKNKSKKTGYSCQCNSCRKLYRDENKEKIAAQKKLHYEENKEKIAAQLKRYYEANKEKLAEYEKLYREENKEKIAEYSKTYQEENKEKINAQRKLYREENKEKIAEYKKRYREDVTDVYIKGLLAKHSTLSAKDIPQWLVELKRAEIQHKRAIQKGIL